VVYNHLGPDGNYLHPFGPYFTDRYETPWGEAVNLDGPDSDEVRQFFIDNALMWLRDYHMDGLRIDAVHAIVDTSPIHFLEELAAKVDQLQTALGRHLVVIAESDLNDPRVVRPPALGGYGIDAQWNEDFHHALHATLTGEQDGYYQDFGTLAGLAKVLTQGFLYDGCYSLYRRRRHGRPATGLSGHRFVGCLQNHDQIGNRATGDRTSHLLSSGQLKMGAALVLTSPFVPMLFQGEEWAASTPFCYFTDHQDTALGKAVKEGRRKEFAAFGWSPDDIPDPEAEETFLRSKLDWDERSRRPHSDMLQWYRTLIELRRRCPALTDSRLSATRVYYDEDAHWLTMTRGPMRVVCNFADRQQPVACSLLAPMETLLSAQEGVNVEGDAILLPAHSAVILGGA
jgi:maltooligosyltrehalose trehalohydrolase